LTISLDGVPVIEAEKDVFEEEIGEPGTVRTSLSVSVAVVSVVEEDNAGASVDWGEV
jgi:hypothetical protein